MARLDQVIEQQTNVEFSPLIDETLEATKKARTLSSLIPPGMELRRGDSLLAITESIEEVIERGRRKAFLESQGNLPPEIEKTILISGNKGKPVIYFNYEDTLTSASRAKKGSLKNLRVVADKLGFILTPAEYVGDSIWDMAKEKRGGKNEATEFWGEMKSEFDVFVMGPLGIFDLNKQINAQDDKPIYWDTKNPVIASLEMVTPAMKMLASRITSLEERTATIEQNVGKMNEQLHKLEAQVAENLRQAAIENSSMAERIRRLEAAQFTRRDPLVFAVPSGTNVITSNTFIILGPCWGEEFKDVVFEAVGLKIVR